MPVRLRTAGPLFVRASTAPADLPIPTGLDPNHSPVMEVTTWLRQAWSRADVQDAVTIASPDLAARLTTLLAAEAPRSRAVRRAARSLAGYLVRWQRRAAPFGLFAGVTTATLTPSGEHGDTTVLGRRVVARPDTAWLRAIGDRFARDPALREWLDVVANPLAVERDGRFLLEPRFTGSGHSAVTREISVRSAAPVRAVLRDAVEPVDLADLAVRLSTATGADPERVATLLDALLDQGFLLPSTMPSSTAADDLPRLIAAAANGSDRATREQLASLAALLDRHNTLDDRNAPADKATAAMLRADAASVMRTLAPTASTLLAVDTRLEASITIPPAVVDEAERAASALLRLTSEPFGAVRWLDYHSRFRARYGAGALVPVRDLVSDAGLGYPTGFHGAARTRPAWRQITDRDAALLNLLQRPRHDGTDEVVLTEADVDSLSVGDPAMVVPPARCELGFTLHTASTEVLQHGDFLLRLTAAPEASTSLTGRFAHLLDPAVQVELANYFAAPAGAGDGPVVAQLVFRARRENADNVVRVPVVTGHVIVLDEHYDGPAHRLGVDDLGVGADDAQMYLVQISTGRRVVPVISHALELSSRTPPLARFLAEVADARCAVYRPFDFGAARTLDHTPRVRYRRTILSPERWVLHPTQLPAPGSPWLDRFDAWRTQTRVPSQVILDDGGTHLPLDLDQPLDRALLEHLAARKERVELHEQLPDPDTWLGRPAEVVVPMVPEHPPARRPPIALTAPDRPHLVADGVITVRLAGSPARFDQIITDHAPRLAGALAGAGLARWWFTRLRDLILPERDQYLALTLQFGTDDAAAGAVVTINALLADLAARGLPTEASLHPHHAHTGVFGTGKVLHAAYNVFAADALAAIEQTRLARETRAPAQAMAAASFASIASSLAGAGGDSVLGEPAAGHRMVLAQVPHASAQLDRDLVEAASRLADPTDDYKTLRAELGDALADAWGSRRAALATYRDLLIGQQRPPGDVLLPLWRGHHARALGVDPDLELTTRLITRRVAQRHLSLAGTR